MTSTRATATDYNMTAGSSSSGNNFTNFKTETDMPLPLHGMNEDQLSKLNDAVQELETHLLHCVDKVRQHQWPASPLKTEACCKGGRLVSPARGWEKKKRTLTKIPLIALQ